MTYADEFNRALTLGLIDKFPIPSSLCCTGLVASGLAPLVLTAHNGPKYAAALVAGGCLCCVLSAAVLFTQWGDYTRQGERSPQ